MIASTHPWLLLLCLGATLLLLGATSGLVNARLGGVSEPLICAAAGIAIGPLGLDLLHLDIAHSQAARDFFREAARITLAIAVLGAGMRVPRHWLRANWAGLTVALGPGMILMWACGALAAYATLALPPLLCLLAGAILAPTDPVLSAPVVGGQLALRAIPPNLRHAITAESGINDGLAAPYLAIPVLLLTAHGPRGWGSLAADWAIDTLLWQTGSAILLGAAAGYVASRIMQWASRQPDAEHASLLTIALALALMVLGLLQAVGGNGVLAAYVAGATLARAYIGEYEQHQEHFNEAIARFFDLPIIFLFGAALPWDEWLRMGWRAPAFALTILLIRRLPAWLLLRRWLPFSRTLPQALFAGWFGPMGAAALFYACDVQDQTGLTALWPITSLAVAASVLAHGATSTSFTIALGRLRRSAPGPAPADSP